MTTLADTARVLALIQTFDNRKVDELTVASWHSVIERLPFDDTCEAVRRYYARTREWVMPSDVVAGVKAIRADRLDRRPDAVPDADPDQPADYLEALREHRMRTADGATPRIMPELRRVFPALPSAEPRPDGAPRNAPSLTGLPPVDDEVAMAKARAEVAAREPIPLPNEETVS